MHLRSHADQIRTRGMIAYRQGVSLLTRGFIFYIHITERPSGRYRKGPSNLPKFEPCKTKIVTITCYANGEVYTETIIVGCKTEVTVDNVDIVQVDNKVEIRVVGVDTL